MRVIIRYFASIFVSIRVMDSRRVKPREAVMAPLIAARYTCHSRYTCRSCAFRDSPTFTAWRTLDFVTFLDVVSPLSGINTSERHLARARKGTRRLHVVTAQRSDGGYGGNFTRFESAHIGSTRTFDRDVNAFRIEITFNSITMHHLISIFSFYNLIRFPEFEMNGLRRKTETAPWNYFTSVSQWIVLRGRRGLKFLRQNYYYVTGAKLIRITITIGNFELCRNPIFNRWYENHLCDVCHLKCTPKRFFSLENDWHSRRNSHAQMKNLRD